MDIYQYPVSYSVVVTYELRSEVRKDTVGRNLTLDDAQSIAESCRHNHRRLYLDVEIVAHPAIPYTVYQEHQP